MTTYWCEACGKECTPVLRDVGPSADCCFEARLMSANVADNSSLPHEEELSYELDNADDANGYADALLTRFEEQELAYELHDEADAERTPAERARHRVMGEP